MMEVLDFLCALKRKLWRIVTAPRGLLLANNCHSKAGSGWPSIIGLLALTSCLFLPVIALGQADTPSRSSTEKKSTSSAKTRSTYQSAASHSSSTTHSSTHRKSNSVASSHSSKGKRSKSKRTARGQQKIDPQRAQEIQEALVREHYMTGEPTGKWDQSSEDALRRYQADHGWQSKTVPDSRALISLGLGPSHDHLLNPESAMTTGPEVSRPAGVQSSSPIPLSHSGDAVPTSPRPTPAADPVSNSSQHDPSSQKK
jgi:Putative peptidoglycan binding domain